MKCPDCDKPSLPFGDSDNGFCLYHEIEFLKWCITANRARIKELEQEQKGNENGQLGQTQEHKVYPKK